MNETDFSIMNCQANQDNIIPQIRLINRLVHRLDLGWIESGKVRRFLIKRHLEDIHPGKPDRDKP